MSNNKDKTEFDLGDYMLSVAFKICIVGGTIMFVLFLFLIVNTKNLLNSFKSNDIHIHVISLADHERKLFNKNLELIADKKCNNKYQQYGYKSGDYSANIICRDGQQFDLQLKDIMSYSKEE